MDIFSEAEKFPDMKTTLEQIQEFGSKHKNAKLGLEKEFISFCNEETDETPFLTFSLLKDILLDSQKSYKFALKGIPSELIINQNEVNISMKSNQQALKGQIDDEYDNKLPPQVIKDMEKSLEYLSKEPESDWNQVKDKKIGDAIVHIKFDSKNSVMYQKVKLHDKEIPPEIYAKVMFSDEIILKRDSKMKKCESFKRINKYQDHQYNYIKTPFIVDDREMVVRKTLVEEYKGYRYVEFGESVELEEYPFKKGVVRAVVKARVNGIKDDKNGGSFIEMYQEFCIGVKIFILIFFRGIFLRFLSTRCLRKDQLKLWLS